jgi:serralysin
VCTVTFANSPNYESPADAGGNNVYDLTIAFTDGTNALGAQTTAITITDANDQTPAVTVAATYSQAEAAATTFQAFTMVDTDSAGAYDCTLGGTDSALFAKSVTDKVCTVTFANNPDYDAPADDGGNNVYDLTIAFTDGTNTLGAQTTAITITDANDQTPAVTVAAIYF